MPEQAKKPSLIPFGYDPIKDENKPLNLSEFVLLTIGMLYEYWSCFLDQNEFHRKPHTYREWHNSFMGWKSW